MASEYRVVWQRAGCRKKRKRYLSRRMAERFMVLLGPEPWTALGKDPDELVCCPGSVYDQCACGGLTYRKQSEETRKDMPAIEYVRLEVRSVGPWEKA